MGRPPRCHSLRGHSRRRSAAHDASARMSARCGSQGRLDAFAEKRDRRAPHGVRLATHWRCAHRGACDATLHHRSHHARCHHHSRRAGTHVGTHVGTHGVVRAESATETRQHQTHETTIHSRSHLPEQHHGRDCCPHGRSPLGHSPHGQSSPPRSSRGPPGRSLPCHDPCGRATRHRHLSSLCGPARAPLQSAFAAPRRQLRQTSHRAYWTTAARPRPRALQGTPWPLPCRYPFP